MGYKSQLHLEQRALECTPLVLNFPGGGEEEKKWASLQEKIIFNLG